MNPERQARENAIWQIAYLREMGVEPLPLSHRTFRDYYADLQRQRAKIEQATDPKALVQLRMKTRAVIAKFGLEYVASGLVPDTVDQAVGTQNTEAEPTMKEIRRCQRKLRHKDYLAAMKHAARIHDSSLQIYPCGVCGGLHVGHDPIQTRIGQIWQKVAELDGRLLALKNERVRLERWKGALLRSRTELLSRDAEQQDAFSDDLEMLSLA